LGLKNFTDLFLLSTNEMWKVLQKKCEFSRSRNIIPEKTSLERKTKFRPTLSVAGSTRIGQNLYINNNLSAALSATNLSSLLPHHLSWIDAPWFG
jgi:hypothetical protein